MAEHRAAQMVYKCCEQELLFQKRQAEWKKQDSDKKKKAREDSKKTESNDQAAERRRKNVERQKKARAKKHQLQRNTHVFTGRKSLEVFSETDVRCHAIGKMAYKCIECDAIMFKGETHEGSLIDNTAKFSLCCSKGAIKLPPISEPPSKLQELLTGKRKLNQDFRQNIRAYNSSLAFASMCLTGQEYQFKKPGPYCFRINGQVYHAISQLQPEVGKPPSFSQIYIYDQENEVENRLRSFSHLDEHLLKELQEMIKQINPYAQTYIHAGDILHKNPAADIKLVLKATREKIDPRRYNIPTGSDVAVIIPTDTDNIDQSRDIVVYKSSSHHPNGHLLMRINEKHPMYDPLMYVLMFPYGDKGWELNCHRSTNRHGGKCSAMQFYKYRLMPRSGAFNGIHRMGRLFQQYIVDMYAKIEFERLQYIRYNQNQLRSDLYQGLADAIQNSDTCLDGSQIGKKVILPSSFTGGARYQHQLYQDAMAIVRRYGKPDFFITFTCNPRWEEIRDSLLPNQIAADRPDIVSRVFKLKLHSLLEDLYYSKLPVLGRMIGLIYVIEWQKRGPPHAHILGICDSESKPRGPEDYDKIVCAEIPDKENFPDLNKVVTTFMMHGPCGLSNPSSPCMQDGKCTKNFPKVFVKRTYDGNGYPHYQRRDDGRYIIKNGIKLDNRFVVPYNPYLSKKYNAHINVEICSSIKSCKYLYKYVYKGPDMASVSLGAEDVGEVQPKQTDEIKKFVNSRFITASEGCWRIMGFDIHGRDPSVQRLAVHEENMQTITFNENRLEEAIANVKDTTLTAWFKLNHFDSNANKFKYHEIPEYYVWNIPKHYWMPRKRGYCIGRMYTTNPSQGERHYLRILLHHIPGATSFSDLRTLPNGTQMKTFKETALALGLLESDEEWDACLAEAAASFMPQQLRSLFITVLIFGEPSQPLLLWEKYKDVLSEDLLHTLGLEKRSENECLLLLKDELEAMGKSLEDYQLPIPDERKRIQKTPRVIQDEMFDEDIQRMISEAKHQSLNSDQLYAFDVIMSAVQDEKVTERLFFLNAPGGYGKTFLIETLLSTVRSMGKVALAVASSGIAAELLEGGRTAHSRFKIPIPVNESSICSVSAQSNDAKLFKKTLLVIWDEIMMSHVHQVDCVDRSLRDIMQHDHPFGGIVVVFGGDPRQILPVVRHGDRASIVKACVQSSKIWDQVQELRLNKNMRLGENEISFAEYLLTVGDGTAQVCSEIGEDIVQIPKQFLVNTLDSLIEKTFPAIEEGYKDRYYVSRRAILTPKNENVDKLNEIIMSRFPGQGKTYLSADTVDEKDSENLYPTEFLNSITLSGMPPHSMTLKIGAPVMLLRNLRGGPGSGLRNGTRLIILDMGEKVIEVEIATGVNKGNRVLIPRITIAPSDTELPFTLRRRQFPIRPCFAMSTNKAQGQTLDYVGVYLPEHVFTHGQLYVALSRVRNSHSVAVYVDNDDGCTKNIVYKEVL